MNYYNEIKNELTNNEIYKKIKDYSKNRSDLKTYYNVGKLLVEAQGGEDRAKYGDGLIKEYSKRLTTELGKGYTLSALKRMRQFYIIIKKGATLSHQLMWSHYIEIVKINSINSINYYIQITKEQSLSIRELRNRIKSNEYERLDEKTKNKLIIKNKNNHAEISEKILKQLILEDISNFMKELGNGFCYIDSEYKIKVGDRYNYIDLLLYNIKFNCYVVI